MGPKQPIRPKAIPINVPTIRLFRQVAGERIMEIGVGVLLRMATPNTLVEGYNMSFVLPDTASRREKGGDAAEAWFMFIPMPTREEQWVWMDRLTCVRAIYIPASYKSGEKYPDLCTYIHVNFTQMESIEIDHQKPTSEGNISNGLRKIECTKEWGLDVDGKTALGINPARLITALVIPRNSRKVDAFSSKSIVLMDSDDIPNAVLVEEFDDNCMADWAVVVSENQGLNIKWGEANMDTPWFLEYLKNSVSYAIGYVPIVGPFLAFGWNLAISGIPEGDEGFLDSLREQVPSVQLLEGFVEEIKNLSEEAKPMLKPGVSRQKKEKEQEYVVFDAKTLSAAQNAVKAKSKNKINVRDKDSVFHTLSPSTLGLLAIQNRSALLRLLNEPEDDWEYVSWQANQSRTRITSLPIGDSDEIANLLARLNREGKVKFSEEVKVEKIMKNTYGGSRYYREEKAARYIAEKK